MRIAYIILAHKLPEQLVRLVRKLNTDNTSFFIHVDKKTDDEKYRRMASPISAYANVYFLQRQVCYYGDYGQVGATLKGIQEVMTRDIHCDYVILLSGQDYPIKSNCHIEKVLHESEGQSFIESFALPSEHWADENGGLDRFSYWHLNWRGRRFRFPIRIQFRTTIPNRLWLTLEIPPIRRNLPGNFKMFGGSHFWCLSRYCIEYVHEFVQQNDAFMRFFKYVKTPHEMIFQTILLNSALKDLLVNDNLRYFDWSRNSSHPEILCKQDFERFINKDKLFARKFDVTVDADVLDMIDRRIAS